MRRTALAAVSPAAMIQCAIYTRKSTEEGLEMAFNTLDAQRESAEAYIASQAQEGWVAIPTRYDDGGFTGANMERPALKRLLEDVRAGEVNCIVVYKIDRLTRSLLDFSQLVEVLDKHNVSFVAVTQQFNTTSSLGRLTLNILLSFAQFEREMIGERTRDKMSAARRKGKWIGGNPVLGYDLLPNGGGLVVNTLEAVRVQAIYQLYLELGSLIPVIKELDRRDWRMKAWTTKRGKAVGGKAFTKNRLYNLLTSILYTGRIRYEDQVYPGEQPSLIETDTWNRVQEMLNGNARSGGRQVRNKYGAILKGILQCGTCKVGMVHTYTQKGSRLYRYYVCVNAHQRGWNTCQTRSVSAPAIERAVIEQLRGMGKNPDLINRVVAQLQSRQREQVVSLHRERNAIEKELARHSDQDRVHSGAAQQGLKSELQSRLREIGSELDTLQDRMEPAEVERALRGFDPLWDQMSIREQDHFTKALVERVAYDGQTGGVSIAFRSTGLKALCGK